MCKLAGIGLYMRFIARDSEVECSYGIFGWRRANLCYEVMVWHLGSL